MIRVLVAEDSAVTREYLVYLLAKDRLLSVVGAARNGEEAVDLAARLRPDVILMDVHMPLLDGYEAARRIMERVPTPIVMASASSSQLEARGVFEALQAGALVLVEKPRGPDDPAQAEAACELVRTLKLMAEVKVVRRWPTRRPPAPVPRLHEAGRAIRVIAIGASAGGPPVVAEILGRLSGDLTCPILLVQHIAPGFTAGLAEWLGTATPLAVKLPEADEPARAGTVYVAPGGSQMGIAKDGRIVLAPNVAVNGFCPSASHLFHSVAASFGPAAVGIVLTGMGRDGADGLRRLRDAGGMTIAQDEATSVVFGMPGEAVRVGAAKLVLPPETIAATIRSLADPGEI